MWIGKGPRSYPSLTREGEQACLDLDLLLTNQAFQEGLCVCAQEKMVRQWLEEVHRDLLVVWRGGKGGREREGKGYSPKGPCGKLHIRTTWCHPAEVG